MSTEDLQKQTAGVAPKLQPKSVGPHEMIKALGNSAYKLQLPREFGKVHDVFHASLLKPYQDGSDQFPSRAASSRQAPVWFSRDEAMWEVEAIVGKKRNKYLVNVTKLARYCGPSGPGRRSRVTSRRKAQNISTRTRKRPRFQMDKRI